MSNETKSKTRTKQTAVSEEIVEDVVIRKPIVPKDIDISQLVVVRNGYQGRLVYKSPFKRCNSLI